MYNGESSSFNDVAKSSSAERNLTCPRRNRPLHTCTCLVSIGQSVKLGYRMLARLVTLRAKLAARHTRAQRLGLTHNECAAVKDNGRDDGRSLKIK